MQYIVMDLEWNGAHSASVGRYYNEIIEIGAVRLTEDAAVADSFSVLIRPVMSKRISSIVHGLTSLTMRDLRNGVDFFAALEQFTFWVGDEETVFLTWGNTDLLVLLEDCKQNLGEERIPFLEAYADLQQYAQARLCPESTQQLGLAPAAEMLGIKSEAGALHRALEDSRLSAAIFSTLYEPGTLEHFVQDATRQEFYARLTFKVIAITDLKSPLLPRSALRFFCPICGHRARRVRPWLIRSRSFAALFYCKRCKQHYNVRLQCKMLYDGLSIKQTVHTVQPDSTPADGEIICEKEQTNIIKPDGGTR